MAKKLVPGHFATFTLTGGIKTSGLIMSVAEATVSYHDEETRLLCSVPREDIPKIHTCEPATKAQAVLAVPRAPIQVPGQEVGRALRPQKKVKVEILQATAKAANSTGGTKLDRAVAIIKANPGATQAQLVQMFVDQLDMTPAGARTYYYNASKRI